MDAVSLQGVWLLFPLVVTSPAPARTGGTVGGGGPPPWRRASHRSAAVGAQDAIDRIEHQRLEDEWNRSADVDAAEDDDLLLLAAALTEYYEW